MISTVPPADSQGSSTRPYLVRALHEWCTDNGFTPYLAVFVAPGVQVPMEYVKNNEIVLNVGFEATSGLKLGNELVEFKARFGGVSREIAVPIDHVVAIYARENGQGMAFPMPAAGPRAEVSPAEPARVPTLRLARVDSDRPADQGGTAGSVVTLHDLDTDGVASGTPGAARHPKGPAKQDGRHPRPSALKPAPSGTPHPAPAASAPVAATDSSPDAPPDSPPSGPGRLPAGGRPALKRIK